MRHECVPWGALSPTPPYLCCPYTVPPQSLHCPSAIPTLSLRNPYTVPPQSLHCPSAIPTPSLRQLSASLHHLSASLLRP
ncbi:hypothetical protein BDZ97DRAFT_145134 [Flammula alnicola]|nr:hypothetical protein BDZ97DRAFT_145134 [Flammula alnicola]